MDIPSAATISQFQHALTQHQIQTNVAGKANEVAKAQGEMILGLLDAAAVNGDHSTGAAESIDIIA